MKKLSKILLSVAAASAVAATMAISAMAEDTITGEYNKETGVVTFTSDIAPTGVSQTLLVLTDDDGTVLSSEIAQIDQRDHGESFSSFALPAGLPESAEGSPSSVTYYIKIGGKNGTIQTGTLTIEASETPIETVTWVFGNANFDTKGRVNASDARTVAQYAAGVRTMTNAEMFGKTYTIVSAPDGVDYPETWVFGNFNFDTKGRVNASDARTVAQYAAGVRTMDYANMFGQEIEIAEVE